MKLIEALKLIRRRQRQIEANEGVFEPLLVEPHPELEGKFGVRIGARPSEGLAYYTVAEYRGTLADLKKYFEPNQTLMVEVELKRQLVEGVFPGRPARAPLSQ